MRQLNAQGPNGLIDRKAPGQTPRLTDAHRAALVRMIEDGPIPAIHGVVRWRLVDLCQWTFEEFRVTISPQTTSREVRALGYRKLSARPRHHAQAVGAIEAFKNVWPAPSASDFVERAFFSLLQRIGPRAHVPRQDGDTRDPVLIKLTASSAIF